MHSAQMEILYTMADIHKVCFEMRGFTPFCSLQVGGVTTVPRICWTTLLPACAPPIL